MTVVTKNMSMCPYCQGTGQVTDGHHVGICGLCRGARMVKEPSEEERCPDCHGTGRVTLHIVPGEPSVIHCWACDQTGVKGGVAPTSTFCQVVSSDSL